MIYQYIVTLKKDNENAVDITNFILCLLSVVIFTFMEITKKTLHYFFIIAAVVVAAGVFFNLYIKIKKNKPIRFRGLLLLTGILWIRMPYLQWLSVLFVILFFLEFQAKRALEVGFTDDLVVINSLVKRKFQWGDFNNIILKDGLLTLDFKNNTVFQKEALDDEEPDAEEDEFNDYCKKQLDRSAHVI
jgi:hypothetical protein